MSPTSASSARPSSATPASASASPARPTKKSTMDSMRSDLAALGLETKGKKDTLFRRLLNAWARSPSPQAHDDDFSETETEDEVFLPASKQPYTSFLCFDVEATCETGVSFDYPNEIIEFPVVLLQWVEDDPPARSQYDKGQARAGPSKPRQRIRRLKKIDTFHSYVRPTWQPQLSDFCTSLTGITQDMVDRSPTFPEMLLQLEDWMDSWGLREGDRLKDAMWVTDGPWDLRDFIPKQLHITPTSPPRYPAYLLAPYLNIKSAVQAVLLELHKRAQVAGAGGLLAGSTEGAEDSLLSPTLLQRMDDYASSKGRRPWTRMTTGHNTSKATKDRFKAMGIDYYFNIKGMLKALDLGDFQGHLHSGIDDASNVARILTAIADRDVLIEPNSRLPPAKNAKSWLWMGKKGEIIWPLPPPAIAPAMDIVAPSTTSVPSDITDPFLPAKSGKGKKGKRTSDVARNGTSETMDTEGAAQQAIACCAESVACETEATASASLPAAFGSQGATHDADDRVSGATDGTTAEPVAAASNLQTAELVASPNSAASHVPPERFLILHASETGNAQDLAERMAREVRRFHRRVTCMSMEHYPVEDLVHESLIAIITSTHGRGDEPPAMRPLWAKLIRQGLPEDILEDVHYSVYGLGDSSYDRFCYAGKMLARRLDALGADKLSEPVWGDERAPDGYEETFKPWLSATVKAALPYLPQTSENVPLDSAELLEPLYRLEPGHIAWTTTPIGWGHARITHNRRVTPSGWWQDVREIEIDPLDPVAYAPGSICSLLPRNSKEEVDTFLNLMGLEDAADAIITVCAIDGNPLPPHIPSSSTTLRALLTENLDLRAPPRTSFFEWLLRFCPASEEQERVRERLQDFISDPDEIHNYASRPKRSIVETLAEFPDIQIPLEYILEVLPPMRRRQFSIASSAAAHGGKVQLLVALVEYKTNLSVPRRGLCSSWLDTLPAGTVIPIHIDAPTLQMPPADTPLILVGPGTGVAPMRAIIEDRVKQGAVDTSLYFGCRSLSADYYYAAEWEQYRKHGLRIEVAASRDQGSKIYVQHLIRRDAAVVRSLLLRGAWVFISGSSNAMPREVREALAYTLSHDGGGDLDDEAAAAYVEDMFNGDRGQEESW